LESSQAMSLAGWLREFRQRAGWTQTVLAHKLGVTRSTIARWEGGRTTPIPIYLAVLGHLGRDYHLARPPRRSDGGERVPSNYCE
jgi:transcriptional regulator with XRE-family HTH domain